MSPTRLREAGVPIVDADVLAREVVAPGTPALAAIRKRFGPDAVRRDGTMDRVRVGADRLQGQARPPRPRSDHPSRRRQGRSTISSPRCRSARRSRSPIFRWSSRPAATRTSTRWWWSPARARCSCTRLMERNKLSKEDAERRLAAQLPIEQKVKKADLRHHDGRHLRRDRCADRRACRGAEGREIEIVTTAAPPTRASHFDGRFLRRRDPLFDERIPLVAMRALPQQLGAAVAALQADVRVEEEHRDRADSM